MKKFLSLILALTMLACMSATAFAADDHSGTQTIITSKAAPGYTLTIPADTSIPWGTTASYNVGKFYVSADDGFDFDKYYITVTWGEGGEFTSSTPGVTTTIPYILSAFSDMSPESSMRFVTSYNHSIYMQVEEAAWKAADPGEYSTTITYTSEIDAY